MIKRILKGANKTISVLSLMAIVLAIGVSAQENGTTASTSAPAAKKSLSAKDELMGKLRASLKNPAEFTANLAEFLNKYPYDERGGSYICSLNSSLKNEKNLDTVRNLINQFVKNTEQVPSPLKANIYRYSAGVLFNNKFYEETADLSQKTIDLLNESDYLEFKRKQFDEYQTEAAKKQREKDMEEAIKKNPQLEKQYQKALKTPRKPPQFNLERAKIDFIGLKTNAYNTLGKSLWEQSKSGEAEKAYRDSFAVKPTKESALGIAKASEKNGKDAEALKYATTAALTGKLEPGEMDYFYSLYAKQHQGKTDDVEGYLDAEFKKTYRNPVKGEKYKPSSKRSDRTVLAEFITGAGCVPCIPFDYSFETVLEDYSPKEVALLVYHWHAPTMDPLGNNSSDSRVKYYDVKGAPTVFIDGKKVSGEDNYNGGEGEANKIQETYDALNEQIEPLLESPAEARIKLEAKRDGQSVKVNVSADNLKNVSDDITLHVALVENEISYSGENGLRFQMMVVRALAGDNDKRNFGFKIDPSKANEVEYVFDVDKIVAQNLNYYDTHSAERMKEFLDRMGGKMPEGLNITFNFKYKKNQINSNNLSVAAFLQDNKTKKILQSSLVNLASK